MGYSPWPIFKMLSFLEFCCFLENALISRIFAVFWSGFLHRTTLNDL